MNLSSQWNPKETQIIMQVMACMISTHNFDVYIRNQALGDCQHLTDKAYNLCKSFGLTNINRISGGLQYPVSIVSSEGIQCDELTHYWLESDGRILELCKGTIIDVQSRVPLVNYVDLNSLEPDPHFIYNK